jgi:hypothetical protein
MYAIIEKGKSVDTFTRSASSGFLESMLSSSNTRSHTPNTFFSSFRVASPLANANCAHAAHTGLSQVQVLGGGGDEAVK